MKISRRSLARHIGMLAGTSTILGAGAVHALVATPRQTAGPFYPPKPHAETDVDLTLLDGRPEPAAGDVIFVRGRVTNTNGDPLANARVDIWQANHYGRYAHPADRNPAPLDPNFQGIGITRTAEDGAYGFRTIMPAPYRISPSANAAIRPRHIHFKVSHESASELTTQMYFAGDPLIENDGVMRRTPVAQRAGLITRAVEDEETGLPVHRFNIVLA